MVNLGAATFNASSVVSGLVEGSPTAYGAVTADLGAANVSAGFSLPGGGATAAQLDALEAQVAAQLGVAAANVTAEQTASGGGSGTAGRRRAALQTATTTTPVALSVNGLPAADTTAVRNAGSLLASAAALSSLLTQAGLSGVSADTLSATLTAPSVRVQATIRLSLTDASAAQEAAAKQALAVDSGAHTAAVSARFPGGLVLPAGSALAKPAAAALFVPAQYVQTCAAVGLTCYPGAHPVIENVVSVGSAGCCHGRAGAGAAWLGQHSRSLRGLLLACFPTRGIVSMRIGARWFLPWLRRSSLDP